MRSQYINFLMVFFLFSTVGIGQNIKKNINYSLEWNDPMEYGLHSEETKLALNFDGAQYNLFSSNVPFFYEQLPTDASEKATNVNIVNAQYVALTSEEANIVDQNVEETHNLSVINSIIKKRQANFVKLYPIRKNPRTGILEKLVSFELQVQTIKENSQRVNKTNHYADNSVLQAGEWYKVGVLESKVYKLSYHFLKQMGMDVDNLNPQNLRVYGNGGGKLPELNSVSRPDDLLENAIMVVDGNDGQFNPDDYILFYGEAPVEWYYDTLKNSYKHITNNYSDTTFYFITSDLGVGKRISNRNNGDALNATESINSFIDYKVFEKDQINLLKSGSEWLGDVYDKKTNYNYSFNFPNIINDSSASFRFYGVARSGVGSQFNIDVSGESFVSSVTPSNITYYAAKYANTSVQEERFYPQGELFQFNVTYNKPQNSSIGWLNYIEVNAWRKLDLSGNQMLFRNIHAKNSSETYEFSIGNINNKLQVWDVSDPANIVEQDYFILGNKAAFRISTSKVNEFLTFTRADSSVIPIGTVPNQNLHALGQVDMAIVSHPRFLTAANSLANFHQSNGLNVAVVTPQQIYNEFSSGAQDAVAIRSFMKMFYDRAQSVSELPSYLLLFGDASYDLKDRISGNTNYVISYPSNEYLNPPYSYVSDDYFGLLDDSEGRWASNEQLDIGIGRLPVQTVQQSIDVVNKIINYSSPQSLGEWRNVFTFVGDDEEGPVHTRQSNDLANLVEDSAREFNISKIFLDAYQQQSTPGGDRYPGVNQAITQKVEKGSLVVNYTGHGGETGWAEERVLTINDILSWNNLDNLPLFITATCEFSRYDDPMRTSGGEHVLLSPKGGGIGLLTTTRLAFSSQNFSLSQTLYKKIFGRSNGKPLTMGEIYHRIKTAKANDPNARNFTYLGDPAVRLAIPIHNVVTTTINGKPVAQTDTLKALSKVVVEGYVADYTTGNRIQGFNGYLYPTVYDKKRTVTTLNNDGEGTFTYKTQDSRIFNGKATVTDGKFSFTFMVPKDISYEYGNGKISYYSDNSIMDANGYTTDFIIGGSNDSLIADDDGPEIEAFLNSEDFVMGGITNETPTLIANLSDDQGINTVGNGIGHDITLIIDGDSENAINLNEFYEAEVDNFQKGKVEYKMSALSEGKHTATIKAWDITNKSAETTIEFVVVKEKDIEIDHVLNYPNPFTTHTEFWFEHNQPGIPLDVKVQIFTISGKLVKSIDQIVVSEGFRVNDIAWNGLDDFGDKIGRGVYLYKLKVRSRNGTMAEKIEKLVIL